MKPTLKYLLPLIIIITSFSCSSNKNLPEETINWMTFEEVALAMEKNPKKIFIDVYTDWCGWCKRMDKKTFSDAKVIKYMNENYYAIKWDAEYKNDVTFNGVSYSNPEPDKMYSIHNLTYELATINDQVSFPSLVYLNEEYIYLVKKATMQYPDDFMADLKYYGDNIYKTTSYSKYITDYFRGVEFE